MLMALAMQMNNSGNVRLAKYSIGPKVFASVMSTALQLVGRNCNECLFLRDRIGGFFVKWTNPNPAAIIRQRGLSYSWILVENFASSNPLSNIFAAIRVFYE